MYRLLWFSDGAPKECRVGEDRRSHPSKVALNHATKDLQTKLCTHYLDLRRGM